MTATPGIDAGFAIADQFSADQQRRWKLKLVLAPQPALNQAQGALASGPGDSFAQLVEAMSGPVTRLVAIHLYNALIANGVSFADARSVNLSAWGATQQFFQRQVPFSLVPLTSAYCPREIHEFFPVAYAAMLDNQLHEVRHTEVREALVGLIRELAGDPTA